MYDEQYEELLRMHTILYRLDEILLLSRSIQIGVTPSSLYFANATGRHTNVNWYASATSLHELMEKLYNKAVEGSAGIPAD